MAVTENADFARMGDREQFWELRYAGGSLALTFLAGTGELGLLVVDRAGVATLRVLTDEELSSLAVLLIRYMVWREAEALP